MSKANILKIQTLPELQYITESHLDNFIIEALKNFRFFQEFLVKTYKPNFKSLEHIKSEKGKIEYEGQTDVKSFFKVDSKLTLFMIENKIGHEQQLDQSARYLIRGKKHIDNRECESFATFLVAPKEYIEKRKPVYQFIITIEEIRDLFKLQNLSYEVKFLELFIEKCSLGYIKIVDPSHTEKWVKIYNEILNLYLILNPAKPNDKSKAEFYRMRPPMLQGRKDNILRYKFQAYDSSNPKHIKGERHRADLEFNYKHFSIEDVILKFENFLEPDMRIAELQGRKGKKSTAIRLCFRDVTFEKSFDEERDIYVEGINGLWQLYQFYLKYIGESQN